MSVAIADPLPSSAPLRKQRALGTALADRLIVFFLALILLRGLFSGWDLAYDFNVPKAARWGIDLGIYAVPAAIALAHIRGRHILAGVVFLTTYAALSLVAGIVAYDSPFGIEKSLSLTFINTLQFGCIVVTCAAVLNGNIRISERALDLIARFGVAYVFLSVLLVAAIGVHYSNGGEVIRAGGRFLFISPISFRMTSTFSEPSYLGFYIGFSALHFYLRKPGTRSALFIIIAGAIIYFAVGAKFAVIAYPLTLLITPLVRRLSLNFVRVALYSSVVVLFCAIVFGLDEYIYRNIFSKIDYEDQQTFVARFAYIFASFRHLAIFPFGTGFGGWLFSLPSTMSDTVTMTQGLDNAEIADQLATGFNFAPKDSTSLVLLIAGWLGIVGVIEGFVALLGKARRRQNFSSALVIYVGLSVAVYINAIAVPIFFALALVVSAELYRVQKKLPYTVKLRKQT